jgi:hypothetical protein
MSMTKIKNGSNVKLTVSPRFFISLYKPPKNKNKNLCGAKKGHP